MSESAHSDTVLMAVAPWRQQPAGLFKREEKFFLLLLHCFYHLLHLTTFPFCSSTSKVDDSTCAAFTCSTMEGVNAQKWQAGAWNCPYMLLQLWQVAGTYTLLALSNPNMLWSENTTYFYAATASMITILFTTPLKTLFSLVGVFTGTWPWLDQHSY